jgi:hypothetical protein
MAGVPDGRLENSLQMFFGDMPHAKAAKAAKKKGRSDNFGGRVFILP